MPSVPEEHGATASTEPLALLTGLPRRLFSIQRCESEMCGQTDTIWHPIVKKWLCGSCRSGWAEKETQRISPELLDNEDNV